MKPKRQNCKQYKSSWSDIIQKHPTRQCTCTPHAIERYLQKVSGPLLDRIDLHVEVLPVEYEELADTNGGEPTAAIRERVTPPVPSSKNALPVPASTATPRSRPSCCAPCAAARRRRKSC